MIWNWLAPTQSFNRREALIVCVFFEFSSITLQKQFAGEALFCALHSAIGTQSQLTSAIFQARQQGAVNCGGIPEHALGRKQRRHLVCY
jgi:hypothetical protein